MNDIDIPKPTMSTLPLYMVIWISSLSILSSCAVPRKTWSIENKKGKVLDSYQTEERVKSKDKLLLKSKATRDSIQLTGLLYPTCEVVEHKVYEQYVETGYKAGSGSSPYAYSAYTIGALGGALGFLSGIDKGQDNSAVSGENQDEETRITSTAWIALGVGGGLILTGFLNDTIRKSTYPKTITESAGKTESTESKGHTQCGKPEPAKSTKLSVTPPVDDPTDKQTISISLGTDGTTTLSVDNKTLQDKFIYQKPFATVKCADRSESNCTPKDITLSPEMGAKFVLSTKNEADLQNWLELHPDHELADHIQDSLQKVRNTKKRRANGLLEESERLHREDSLEALKKAYSKAKECASIDTNLASKCQELQAEIEDDLSVYKPTRFEKLIFDRNADGYTLFFALRNAYQDLVAPQGEVLVVLVPYRMRQDFKVKVLRTKIEEKDYSEVRVGYKKYVGVKKQLSEREFDRVIRNFSESLDSYRVELMTSDRAMDLNVHFCPEFEPWDCFGGTIELKGHDI